MLWIPISFNRMTRQNRIPLLAFFFLVVLFPVQAQQNLRVSKGYIIKAGNKLDGDIMTGTRSMLQQKCFFRPNSSKNFVEYKPGDIESFFVENEGYFISYSDSRAGKPPLSFFLHVLADGRIKLFDLFERNSIRYFIVKNGILIPLEKSVVMDRTESGAMVKRVHETYKKTLRDSFVECPQDVSKVHLTTSSLLSVISLFNTCLDSTSSIVYKQKRNILSIGYSYGFVNNRLQIDAVDGVLERSDGYYRSDFSTINKNFSFSSVSSGLNFEIGIGQNKHVSMMGGMMVSKTDFSNDKFSIKYTSLDFPVAIKYSFLLGLPIRPHVSVGLLVPFLINNNSRLYPLPFYRFLDLKGNQVSSDGISTKALIMSDNQWDLNNILLTSSVGLDYFVNNRLKITSQFRIQGSSISREDQVGMLLTSKTLFVGLLYRLHQ